MPANRNILLVGDIKVKIIDGHVEIFGAEFTSGSEVSLDRFMSAPLETMEDSEIEVEFGEEGYIAETPMKLIPDDWRDVASKILNLPRSSKVLVCADVDAGKSGFICYTVNRCIGGGKRVAIIGADTGQSEMNPPTTIGLAIASRPIIHLSDLSYISAFFVGSTSPAGMLERSIVGILRMLRMAVDMDVDLILINTTGWVHGSGGRELKELKLIGVNPDMLVIMEKEKGELNYLVALAEKMGIRCEVIQAAPRLRARSREERRMLRKKYYAKEFSGASEVRIMMDEVAFMYSYLGTGVPLDADEMLGVVNTIGFVPEYAEKTKDKVLIITRKNIPEEAVEALKKTLGRPVIVINPTDLENLLVGLLDENLNVLGLGIITKFDPASRILTIHTRVDQKRVRIVALGRIKVNLDYEEVGWLDPWSL